MAGTPVPRSETLDLRDEHGVLGRTQLDAQLVALEDRAVRGGGELPDLAARRAAGARAQEGQGDRRSHTHIVRKSAARAGSCPLPAGSLASAQVRKVLADMHVPPAWRRWSTRAVIAVAIALAVAYVPWRVAGGG